MARKKVPLGNVALAARTASPVVAAAVLHAPAAPGRPSDSDRDAIESQLLQLVTPYSRVLVIGRDTWPLSRALSSVGCQVSVVEGVELDAVLEGAQFDTIVAVRLLEHVRNPVAMLTALGKRLTADGGVVAAVPNVMHARIRLGFLAGRSPAGLLSPDDTAPSRWYDSATLQQTFERAGFLITRIERQLESFDPDGPTDGPRLPPVLVEELTRNADAMTRTYVVQAHPFPLAGHVRLELRVRDLIQSHDRSAEHLKSLEERTDGLDSRYDELKRVCDGISERDTRLQSSLASAHQRLTNDRAGLEAVRRDLTRFQYELLVLRVRALVESALPHGAVALVVSKGDERLVAFNARTGWHFLRHDAGLYAGLLFLLYGG